MGNYYCYGVTRLAGAEHTLKRQNWLNVTVFTAKK